MLTECLKGSRALQTILPPPAGTPFALCDGMPSQAHAYAATETHQRTLHLVSSDQDPDLRDTLPPSADSFPPPGYNPKPSETLRQMVGYDDNQFLHVALAAAADAAHEIREARRQPGIEELLERQTARILKETSADYGSLRSSITGLQQSVDALVTRIGNTETALDAGTKRFQAIEDELSAMRSQMSRLEQLRPHLDRLEAALNQIRQDAVQAPRA